MVAASAAGRSFEGMPTAIVTGASRGLGLALARPSPSAGGGSSSTPAAPGPLNEVAAELARRDVAALPGDVADPEHRAALVAAAGERLDLLVNNASVLGPSPQPALADYPLDTLEQRLPRQRARAAGARSSSRSRTAARIINVTLRRGRRALRGLGRLRLGQGRARPPDRDPRRRAPRPAHLRRRPRRHEHAHAPGGVPRRGHLRPPAARGERARPARADRGRPARPAATAPHELVACMSALPSTPARPRRRTATVRDEVRLMVAPATARPHRLPRPPHPLRAGRPADRQRVGDDSGGVARAQGRRHRRRSAPLHPRTNEGRLGGGGAAATAAASRRTRPRRSRSPRGGRATLLAPYLSPDRLWIAQLDLPEPLLTYLVPPRRADPLRPRARHAR